MAKVIMVQGTMSNAGKSLLAAGLCRIFKQDGYRVAPFKSQNMALNSFITEEGLEMGRAQVMQAEAAGIRPDVCMNPILLKPTNNVGSQVIVNGEVLGNMKARDYFRYKRELIPEIVKAFQKLETMADIIVIEGAGSPAEINLKENDIVNMGLAELVDAPVLLVADIDRGGVFAQLLGTLMLLEPQELARVKGLVINKFRGDKTILDPGIDMLEERGGIPVSGVVPYMDVRLEDEDSLTERFRHHEQGLIDLAVIRTPRISNFTDFNIFELIPGVTVRYVMSSVELGTPDMIFLPGSKNTMGDLKWMRENGLEAAVKKASEHVPVFGICGGYQMLGAEISDPIGVEEGGKMRGMELLPIVTELRSNKTRAQVEGRIGQLSGELAGLSDMEYVGYEIHMGETNWAAENTIGMTGTTKNDDALPVIVQQENVYGSYVHGIFDHGGIAAELVSALARKKNVSIEGDITLSYAEFKEREYDRLADIMRKHMDMDAIYGMLREARIEPKRVSAEETILVEKILSEEVELATPDEHIFREIKSRWDAVAKPLDSLGLFEEMTCRIGSILADPKLNLGKKAIVSFCADNGIVAEGVSQSGQEVTLAVTKAMGRKESSVCKMAKLHGIETFAVDVGVNYEGEIPGVLSRKVARGTENFAQRPAMTRPQALEAMNTGFSMVGQLKARGFRILGTGEMGIGNTTTSCAVAAALLKKPVSTMVGSGAGLSNEGLSRKRKIIEEAIARYDLYEADPMTVLCCVGGFDLAALVGTMIGGAYFGMPIVLDGVITEAAALVAVRMLPRVREYLIASHEGKEPAARVILAELGLRATIYADMALGEGTGAVMSMAQLDTVLALYRKPLDFADLSIDAYQRFS